MLRANNDEVVIVIKIMIMSRKEGQRVQTKESDWNKLLIDDISGD